MILIAKIFGILDTCFPWKSLKEFVSKLKQPTQGPGDRRVEPGESQPPLPSNK